MIRYLYSKVNLWEGKHLFFMMEDKMIYQAECLENTPKKRGQATISGRKVRKREKEKKETVPFFDTRNGARPHFLCKENVACPLF